MPEYDGLLPLNKPRGMTSHDCVGRLRRLLHFRRIGHTGTLDPDVDGVLVICLGRATKIARYLLNCRKTYQGVIRLGRATTTEDASGETIETRDVSPISKAQIKDTFKTFTGEITQTVPLYSAVKVGGKKLYEYARAGLPVTPPVRKVTIYDLKLDDSQEFYTEDIPFTVSCSKGTYVRTLAVDIGRALGFPAHLKTLTRIEIGPFKIDECLTFDQIEVLHNEGRFSACLKPLELGLSHLEKWTVAPELAEKVTHGSILPVPEGFKNKPYAIFDQKGTCLAIYQRHPEKPDFIKPQKVLYVREERFD